MNKDKQEKMMTKPLLFDGAMGTYFATIHNDPLAHCELSNLSNPSLIRQIHEQYLEAGCKAIKTNTFAANTVSLEIPFAQVEKCIEAGWRIASEAAKNHDAEVFADIGPIAGAKEYGIAEEYRQIADQFLRLGARNFLFETFADDKDLAEITAYIKKNCPDAFIITSFAVSPDGFTTEGELGEALLGRAQKNDNVDAAGINCMSGPYHLNQYIATLKNIKKPLSVMPNAGYPTIVGSRAYFGNSASYFGDQMMNILRNGATIIGGCCGTTPDFIHETAKRIAGVPTSRIAVSLRSSQEMPAAQHTHKNRFAEKLAAGKRVTAVELDPPIDMDVTSFMTGAKKLRDTGVDILTIADCPIARARMDSSLLACKVRRELGMDTLPHMTCRDRNLNAIKALLLGLAMEEVHNVLIITGDPIPSARRDEVKSVFNFNSRMLAKFVRSLGEEIASPFLVCGALNVNAVNFEVQLRLAREKIQNGMQAFLTQPVLSMQAMKNLQRAHEELDAKILAGIIPVVSHRNACFMNNEIPGITVSDEITELYEGKSREECASIAVETSVKIAEETIAYSDGWYFMTPFKRVDLIQDILKRLPKA